ncbi:hypothetical protein C2W62_41850 [Candidatus Entotheonella serta]|nr:hypothetical protein C2W62_41850 [Candidatus Entotheonella serta]
MAIAKKPNRNRSASMSPDVEHAAEAFISGADDAAKSAPKEEPRSHKKTPVMVRFDRALLSRVDEAAKHRGISRSAWIQFTLSRALDDGEG